MNRPRFFYILEHLNEDSTDVGLVRPFFIGILCAAVAGGLLAMVAG